MSFIDPNRVAPSISGVININKNYGVLGVGLTDRIFLLGHGDMPTINDPYLVTDIEAAIAILQSNTNSPLLRALLECYYGGAKDIYIMAVAPMSQYIADPTQRSAAWYANYATQLQTAYNILVNWDLVQWLVPLEAPFNITTTDFLTPLAQHCMNALVTTGSIRTALMGTRKGSALTSTDIATMANDSRIAPSGFIYSYGSEVYGGFQPGFPTGAIGINYINNASDIGQFVAIFAGEGVVNLQEMPVTYTTSVVASIAGQLAQLPLNQSIINTKLPNIISLLGIPAVSDIATAANAGINLMTTTTMGRRGKPFQVIAPTDNTLALPGSDFWSVNVCRAVQDIVDYIEALSNRSLRSIGLVQFQLDVQNFLTTLVSTQQIQNYDLSINRNPTNVYNLLVNLTIQPLGMLRTINFTVNVGISAGTLTYTPTSVG